MFFFQENFVRSKSIKIISYNKHILFLIIIVKILKPNLKIILSVKSFVLTEKTNLFYLIVSGIKFLHFYNSIEMQTPNSFYFGLENFLSNNFYLFKFCISDIATFFCFRVNYICKKYFIGFNKNYILMF